MIDLAAPAIDSTCPRCAGRLAVDGWYIPGMRMMARTHCAKCAHRWFVDLPAGQALYSPMILDPDTGAVHDRTGVPWFVDWLRTAYRDRDTARTDLTVTRHRPLTRPAVLVNCVDTLFGHALLKLLNAQPYLDADQVDVILLIQPALAALAPVGVAETWLVDLPLSQGIRWSEGLAEAIANEAARIADLRLAPVVSHPHPATFAIERFSRVTPFAPTRWRDASNPTVTFIWREDRKWLPGRAPFPRSQLKSVVRFFEALRRMLPGLDAAIVGIGQRGGAPDWIADERVRQPSPDTDRAWLRRYAASHAVVGVHGSNMLLPSAHAGSTIELLPDDRAGNFLQDIIFNGSDPRDLFFRCRFVPDTIRPAQLARLTASIVERYPDFQVLMPGNDERVDVRD